MDDKMLKKGLKCRKAQHEIVGFVLIVVLVIIIGLIFLTLSMRQKPADIETESRQAASLLDSMMQYTTDCAIYVPQYESLRDLIKSCYYAETCSDGTSTCQKLQVVVSGILNSAQPHVVSGEQAIKGYEFNASYVAEQQGFFINPKQADIAYVSQGSCGKGGRSIGAQEFLPLDAGNIRVSLRFCY